MHDRPSRRVLTWIAGFCVLLAPWAAHAQQATPPAEQPPQDAAPAQPSAPAADEPLPDPPPIPDLQLDKMLPTREIRRGEVLPTERMVDASVLPRDPEGIWVLDFAYKPVRLRTVEIPGKGRKRVYYLYYRVVNNTGAPRMFVPQFTLVTDTGRRYEDAVIPQAVKVIEAREGADISLLGAVDVVGMLPTSGGKEGIDDAIFGVAVWEDIDPEADKFSIYIRGLSDGYQTVTPPDGGEPRVQYKTLRLDFLRPGDSRNINEREIRVPEPPSEWIYW